MIRFSNIYHQVGDKTLFNDLSWHINPHEHIGLVGNNGTGKTTLLRMIAGEVSPQTGNIYLHKNIT
ncbi:MAG: ATP-binding cassette domain-containing protein, partial [Candidatus Sumerlaeales bacterium]|nr:ATP-binding cassette domain-containing protein [Candidatus Sumerlaeales bacterium]